MPKRKKNCRHEWSGELFLVSLPHPLHRIYYEFKNAASISNLNFKKLRFCVTKANARVVSTEWEVVEKPRESIFSRFSSSLELKYFGEALNFLCAMCVPQVVLIFKMFHLCFSTCESNYQQHSQVFPIVHVQSVVLKGLEFETPLISVMNNLF
jgi:hypothetical protein